MHQVLNTRIKLPYDFLYGLLIKWITPTKLVDVTRTKSYDYVALVKLGKIFRIQMTWAKERGQKLPNDVAH